MRLDLIAAAVLVTACASASPPPGGPEDNAPPRLVRVTPDTNAVNVRAPAATFQFDEVINDRGSGPQDVSSYFLVSPSDGAPRVSWRRSRIDVRPRHGFRPNTAYTITLLPGLTDLRSNAMTEGQTVVFSTGATIPDVFIRGIVFDWVAERPAPRALVQATTPDSVVYLAQADSLGRFSVGPLTAGSYLVRGIIDQNQNRGIDRGEAWDSLRVAAPQPAASVELLAAPRDTLPARIRSASLEDSVTIRLTFDQLLDPAQTFAVASFRLAGPDSAAIPIAAVRTRREEMAEAGRREQAAADSARRADSLAGRPRPPAPTGAPASGGAPAAGAAEGPTPSRPAPFTTISLVVSRPLAQATRYRVSATGVRALTGRSQDSETSCSSAPPAPAAGAAAGGTGTTPGPAPAGPAAGPARPVAPPRRP